jgi:MFS family permease
VSTFRKLLVANVVSDIGIFMQGVGATWLMVSLHAGPIYVALTQTASSLSYFLLALPAGSAGDILDRRKLILSTESWMTGVAQDERLPKRTANWSYACGVLLPAIQLCIT